MDRNTLSGCCICVSVDSLFNFQGSGVFLFLPTLWNQFNFFKFTNITIIVNKCYSKLTMHTHWFYKGMNDKLKSKGDTVQLTVPYKSQLDNRYEPYSACNVTSFGMVFDYYDIGFVHTFSGRHKTNGNSQIEDDIYEYMSKKGLNKHYPEDLARMARDFGLKDDFTVHGTFKRCREHLSNGNLLVLHGYFTQPGHIIVGVGYDSDGFIVHDPYGEWFLTGYRTDLSGAYLHYSNRLIQKTCAYDGEFWVHYLSK